MTRITAEGRRLLIEEYYTRFHQTQYLEWDPLSVIREFEGSPDQEYVALISAIFAFGGVKQIIKSIRNVSTRLQLKEAGPITAFSDSELQSRLKGFAHRIYVDQDLVQLTRLYQKSCVEYGSLKDHFLIHHRENDETIEAGLTGLIRDYKSWSELSGFPVGKSFFHMLNSPEAGSTCKRWLMFLKWMIRADDGIDLGLWYKSSVLRPDQLLIPLDTHLFKISKRLGLTKRKTANWKTAIEVTRNLKKIDARDPTRFDFSLCRFGMFDYRKILKTIET